MKKIIFLFLCIFIFISCFSDWNIGDPHKMHFPQLPDPNGWDVWSGDFYDGEMIADDFQCTESGEITDIHLWISYQSDTPPNIIYAVNIEIWASDPDTGLPSEQGYLWGDGCEWESIIVSGPEYGTQGWFDPYESGYNQADHQQYWQLNIEDISDPFIQEAGTIYWLAVWFETSDDSGMGWKTSLDHFGVTAQYYHNMAWNDILDPLTGATLDFAFVIDNDSSLPLELSSFTAIYSNNLPVLNWVTQSETNNLGWNVFRAEIDDINSSIQLNDELIPGAGTTSSPTEYSYNDVYEVNPGNIYWYWLQSFSTDGDNYNYGPITLNIPEDGEDPNIPEIPDIYGLHQNYPNPFNPDTRISYMMPEDCTGTLTIYDTKGQEVITLFKDRLLGKDEKLYTDWDSRDSNGNLVSSGVYIYKLKTDRGNYSRKMVLAK